MSVVNAVNRAQKKARGASTLSGGMTPPMMPQMFGGPMMPQMYGGGQQMFLVLLYARVLALPRAQNMCFSQRCSEALGDSRQAFRHH